MAQETMQFRTEVKQLLDLMIHSLYSHKEVFLRELISNASDAIDKLRYEALTREDLLEGEADYRIRLIPNRAAGTLTVRDNGIGMSREEAVEELGTIAHSGTKEFLAALREKKPEERSELIGQFGVGFYSSFMVADRVTVLSRRAGEPPERGVRWESSADGSFTVEDVEKPARGTDVILHLTEEGKKFLEEWEIRRTVKAYSDFIEHAIVMDVEKKKESELQKGETYTVTEEETLNSRKAIWLKKKSEVSEEEYADFYRHLSHDTGAPARVIHYRAEGATEFRALLYIPEHLPLGILFKEFEAGPMLYVKRVQIMPHCPELLPPYLRFVRGVVDSADLPLNISREMLQHNRQAEVMKRNITKKVLDALAGMKREEYEKYARVFRELGRVLKEGIYVEPSRREALADLMLYESTARGAGEYTDLEGYVRNMKEGQKDIYYITAASREEALRSPYLESFSAGGYEVLVMLDEIDDIITSALGQYKGKTFRSVLKGELDLGEKEKKEEAARTYGKLVALLKETLSDRVKDVRLSGRLTDSACCLVSGEGELDPATLSLLKAMGQQVPEEKRILEINPDHPLLRAMQARFEKNSADPALKEYAGLLYEQALVLAGRLPGDPAAFVKAMAALMAEALGTRGAGAGETRD
jgi:molecular chaperone HtpG